MFTPRNTFRPVVLCIALSAGILLNSIPGAYAQTPAAAPSIATGLPTKVAVLNIQDIMRDSLAAKSIKEQFDAKQKSFSSDISGKEEALQKEQQELAKQRSVLSQDAFEAKVREFNTKASDVQKEVRKKKSQLDKALSLAFIDVQKTVSNILADLAREKGFNLVLPTQQTLYSDPTLDITPEVLTRLNKNLPKVNVSFDAK